jgi:DnaA family protein
MMKQLLLDFTQAPAPTFQNFVPGGNAEVLATLAEAVRGPVQARVIYVWGDPGAGKTHLLKAFAEASGARRAAYVSGADFAGGSGALLAIDDIEKLSDERQADLFNAFNESAFTLLLVSARSAPRDVAIRRDLATRLATGLTYRVVALTDEEKRAALAAHAKVRGFALGEDVSRYLLTHTRRDMSTLIHALDTLDRYSLETGRPITVPLLKAALQPELAIEPPA